MRIVKCVLAANEVVREVLKFVKVVDGHNGYTVAFSLHVMTNQPYIKRQISKFFTVQELYDASKSTFKKHCSFQNHSHEILLYFGRRSRTLRAIKRMQC